MNQQISGRNTPIWNIVKSVPDICPYTKEPITEILIVASSFDLTSAEREKRALEKQNPHDIFNIEETNTWM